LKGFIKDKNDYIDYVIKYRELRKSLCTIKSHIHLLSDEIHNNIINKTICHNLHNLTLSYLFGLRLVSSLCHVMEPYRIENRIKHVDIWNTFNGLRIKIFYHKTPAPINNPYLSITKCTTKAPQKNKRKHFRKNYNRHSDMIFKFDIVSRTMISRASIKLTKSKMITRYMIRRSLKFHVFISLAIYVSVTPNSQDNMLLDLTNNSLSIFFFSSIIIGTIDFIFFCYFSVFCPFYRVTLTTFTKGEVVTTGQL